MSAPTDFWSRRKQGVIAEQQQSEAAVQAEALAQEQKQLEEKTDEDLLAELNLPDPDTLKEGDDFSAFMSKAVPDRLRRRALRKLWLSNPVLANVDGLVDYGENFTDSAMVVENLQTAYQVGKGMLSHVLEMARQEEETALKTETTLTSDPEPEVGQDQEADLVATQETDATESEAEAQAEAEETDASAQEAETAAFNALPIDGETEALPRRRMRFSYSQDNLEATQ